jgi:CRP-like cAMP-binding protein
MEKFVKYMLKPGDVVYEEGQLGENYYIVNSGSLLMTAAGQPVKKVKARDVFGEVALVDKTPRSCTVAAVEHSAVWALGAMDFKSTLTNINKSRFTEDM